jgi:hypothetical protein
MMLCVTVMMDFIMIVNLKRFSAKVNSCEPLLNSMRYRTYSREFFT